ncbi:MAG: hypothetical protein A3F78_20650 [Burkholderiales bacterium RIFCSPLOWO2_12_FULL_61_40]|nr:MAG: hypothetical protein A3F78_20650 [Burkholderiales bacterium RIFCSPLOWO2_12_FULL_61_40]
MSAKAFQRGFTLVELIMVIVIMGVIGGMVAVFMRSPIDAYFASARRAELTDVADTTVRRMARDIRKALPNSLRLPTTGAPSLCVEFIPTKTGGRYRVAGAAANALVFNAVDSSFNMLGDNAALPADQRIVENDLIAIHNLGIPGADAYAQANTDRVSAAPVAVAGVGVFGTETQIATAGRATPYPLESGSNRFHVIPAAEQVVSYVCTNVGTDANGNGTGTLYRRARAFAAPDPQPAACPLVADIPAGTPVLAQNVSTCAFVFNGNNLQRNATLQVNIDLTQSNETVGLFHEIHVNNTP